VAATLSVREKKNYHDAYEEIRFLHPRTMQYSIGQEIEDKNLEYQDWW
tara:strand:- start:1707 stop:1850 length:144 start_codon:yes stop_codon:yes gene_type:complete